ncbi:excisionase family DNA-binding protein [Bradyrhizobium sp. JYMT SZCCT0428]|nr:excisionase family DNA-binding protein [Bradyrhizobium sp. JYMT SZCCT0428]
MEDLLTIQEIASKLGISSLTVRRRLRAKNISLVRVGRLLRVPSRDAASLFHKETPGEQNHRSSSGVKEISMCFCKNNPSAAPFGCQLVHYADGDREIPVASVVARLKTRNPGPSDHDGVEIDCPKCGERHKHGWGAGPRTPHCKPENRTPGDYYIPEISDVAIKYRK